MVNEIMLLVTQPKYSSQETFAARMVAQDLGYSILYAKDDLFPADPFLPVGSVEFCMSAMRHQGVDVSDGFTPYPAALMGKEFTHRQIEFFLSYKEFLHNIPANAFIKPNWPPKAFVARIISSAATGHLVRPIDLENAETLDAIEENCPIWASEVVRFISEWRYYIVGGKIVGYARYDAGEEEAPVPDFSLVTKAVQCMNDAQEAPAGYVLDFGVLLDGETALVEANDGWAVGLYRGQISRSDYMNMLVARWEQIQKNKSLAF